MKFCLILLFAFVVDYGTAYSQNPASLRDKLFELDRRNLTVRISLAAEPDTVQGRVTRITDTTTVVGSTRISLDAITSIDVRHTQTDPLWNGMAIGIVVNSLAYYVVLRELATLTSRSDDPEVIFGVVASGALFGAVVDLMIGNRDSWTPVWPPQ